MDYEFKLPKFMDASVNRDEEFLNLISDHSSDELREIFEKSLVSKNEALSNNLNKLCSDSLALIYSNIDKKQPSSINNALDHLSLDNCETNCHNNNEIIEKYTKKLLVLQQKLNENFNDHKVEKENIINGAELSDVSNNSKKNKSELKSSSESTKVQFKDVNNYKKDVVVKKLLKTIDIMNQELTKKDKLIKNIESENEILTSKKNTDNFVNEKVHQDQEIQIEISRLKQEIQRERYEKEVIEKKIQLLEKKFLSQEDQILAKKMQFKEVENFQKLQRTNDELKAKIESLTEKIKSDDTKNRFELEVNSKFESLIKEKTLLELENGNLSRKVFDLTEKLREEEIVSKTELKEWKKKFQAEFSELRRTLNEKEETYKNAIDSYENKFKDMTNIIESLDDERNNLSRALNGTQDEKLKMEHQLESHKNLEIKYNELKDQFDKLSYKSLEQTNKINELMKDTETKNLDSATQSVKKGDELKRLRQSLNLGQEKIKYLQAKYETDLANMKKQFAKDVEHLKSANEQTSIRNGEFSRSNGELRKKNRQLEMDLKSANEKCFINKQNADLLCRQKKDLKEEHDRITSDFQNQISALEKLRDEYLKKNAVQQKSVEEMLEQIRSFKVEFDNLVNRNTYLEDKIKQIIVQSEAYKEKYLEIKRSSKKQPVENQVESSTKSIGLDLIHDFVRDLRINERLTSDKAENDAKVNTYTVMYQRNMTVEMSNIQYENFEDADSDSNNKSNEEWSELKNSN